MSILGADPDAPSAGADAAGWEPDAPCTWVQRAGPAFRLGCAAYSSSVSSLWTPGGEHRVPRAPAEPSPPPTSAPGAAPFGVDDLDEEDLTAEQRAHLEAAAEEVAAIRAELAQAPPELVVANHVMGLYELAAIHLSQQTPNLAAAKLAIDALGAVLDACRGRLGENEALLADARSQIQIAFVSVSREAGGS